MDLQFNRRAFFTRWIVKSSALQEPLVVIDVGVQGGENPRWHLLEDHLVLHGFDAIEEVIEGLRKKNSGRPNRHYHWIAAGDIDGEREFFVNTKDLYSSSFYSQGTDRFHSGNGRLEEKRNVPVRRLDSLLAERLIPRADFLKTDVEGFEKDVLLGAQQLMGAGLLGMETETNFGVSPTYPKSHFGTITDMALTHHLLVFDLAYNRIPRGTFHQALTRKGLARSLSSMPFGKPATVNVLLCRDLIAEADHPENYPTKAKPESIDRIIKAMIIYELHGLNDIALDTAVRFRERLGERFDVDEAIDLLADQYSRYVPRRVRLAWRLRRLLRRPFARNFQ